MRYDRNGAVRSVISDLPARGRQAESSAAEVVVAVDFEACTLQQGGKFALVHRHGRHQAQSLGFRVRDILDDPAGKLVAGNARRLRTGRPRTGVACVPLVWAKAWPVSVAG